MLLFSNPPCSLHTSVLPFSALSPLPQDHMEAARDAHAICVLTEWDEFKAYDYQAIYDSMVKPAFIFDGRNILDHAKLRWVAGRRGAGAGLAWVCWCCSLRAGQHVRRCGLRAGRRCCRSHMPASATAIICLSKVCCGVMLPVEPLICH